MRILLAREVWLTPNLITLSRALMLPPLLYLIVSPGLHTQYAAAVLFVLIGITDVLDGYWARSRAQVSTVGTLLDPLLDKAVMASVMLALVAVGQLPLWAAITLWVKEFLLIVGALQRYLLHKRVIPANRLGKLATFVLYVAVTCLLLNIAAGSWLLALGVGLSVLAGAFYLVTHWRS